MKTKALIQNDGWPWHSILLKKRDEKDSHGRQFGAFWRLPYDVVHVIGLKLGFVFSATFYLIEKRSLIFASLKSTDAYPTMFNKINGLNRFSGGEASRYLVEITSHRPKRSISGRRSSCDVIRAKGTYGSRGVTPWGLVGGGFFMACERPRVWIDDRAPGGPVAQRSGGKLRFCFQRIEPQKSRLARVDSQFSVFRNQRLCGRKGWLMGSWWSPMGAPETRGFADGAAILLRTKKIKECNRHQGFGPSDRKRPSCKFPICSSESRVSIMMGADSADQPVRLIRGLSLDPGIEGGTEGFRVLEHTADIGFEASGATREVLFANAGRALIHLVVDLDRIQPQAELRLRVEGSSAEDLLVNWLSEILYLQDAEGWLFCQFKVEQMSECSLTATARGQRFDRARHQAKLLVKAITYHQLAIEQTPEGWRARVYVDI